MFDFQQPTTGQQKIDSTSFQNRKTIHLLCHRPPEKQAAMRTECFVQARTNGIATRNPSHAQSAEKITTARSLTTGLRHFAPVCRAASNMGAANICICSTAIGHPNVTKTHSGRVDRPSLPLNRNPQSRHRSNRLSWNANAKPTALGSGSYWQVSRSPGASRSTR